MKFRSGLFSLLGAVGLVGSCSAPEGTPAAGDNASTGTGGTTQVAECAADLLSCGTSCVDARNDFQNCGACNTPCGPGQGCTDGACQCTGDLSACPSGCVNLTSDGNNCGLCGTACSGGLVCSQGVCSDSCATDEKACGNSCVNTQTDGNNCGFCGNVCAGGQACVNGACACGPGQATCSGVCVGVFSDPNNCGTCGTACGVGQTCSGGICSGGDGGTGGAAGTGGNEGTGGESLGTGGDTVGPPRDNGCAIPAGMVADFEDGVATPVIIPTEDRSGAWEIFNDGTSDNETMSVEPSGGTADCDKNALHVTGSGYSSWGAGFGFSFVGPTESPTPYNAANHNFTGIRFKAKVGSGHHDKSSVRFNVSTPWTENFENPGGQCQPQDATSEKAAVDCYQHMGKFLALGAGERQLSQEWKTFDFCFDRDLYPLSLPSNLTNDQRENLVRSMLKVQFQFNQGKDYSGAYTADYPAFAKDLPFDFWIDDVQLFSGECPNNTASPSNGSPAKPFPQNENVGSCAPAKDAANFASAIADLYATWTAHFVQNDHVVAPEQSGAVTSEALGYGMMIAASMGDKAAFDKFHSYVKAHGGSGSGLMTWKEGGSGSASDGDIDIAFALLMAHKQWPSGGYKSAGDSMASAILSQDLVSNVIRGGSSFKDAPFNPSYFSPAAFRAFGSSFQAALDANYNLVNANINANTKGVPTDWANASNGNPSGPGAAQVTSEITDGENGAMGYDAARVPWRLALDACITGGNTAGLQAIVDFFAAKYDGGATIDLMKAGWYKASGQVHPAAEDSQGSYIGPMGAAGMAVGNDELHNRAFRTILDILENGDFNHTYFPSTVGLLTLLMMSGNFPVP